MELYGGMCVSPGVVPMEKEDAEGDGKGVGRDAGHGEAEGLADPFRNMSQGNGRPTKQIGLVNKTSDREGSTLGWGKKTKEPVGTDAAEDQLFRRELATYIGETGMGNRKPIVRRLHKCFPEVPSDMMKFAIMSFRIKLCEFPVLAVKYVIPESVTPKLRTSGGDTNQSKIWYLDTGASNHMTGDKGKFRDLNMKVQGHVKFGNGSKVRIEGKGTIVFQCKNGEHRKLHEVYYIPDLCSNIISKLKLLLMCPKNGTYWLKGCSLLIPIVFQLALGGTRSLIWINVIKGHYRCWLNDIWMPCNKKCSHGYMVLVNQGEHICHCVMCPVYDDWNKEMKDDPSWSNQYIARGVSPLVLGFIISSCSCIREFMKFLVSCRVVSCRERSKQLQKGSVVRLAEYLRARVDNTTFIKVLDVNVIGTKCDNIGHPKAFPYSATPSVEDCCHDSHLPDEHPLLKGSCTAEGVGHIHWRTENLLYDGALFLFVESAEYRKLWLLLKPESCGKWVKNAGKKFGNFGLIRSKSLVPTFIVNGCNLLVLFKS
nr:hypothetical protein [Tanacetum cinerariifolium]